MNELYYSEARVQTTHNNKSPWTKLKGSTPENFNGANVTVRFELKKPGSIYPVSMFESMFNLKAIMEKNSKGQDKI